MGVLTHPACSAGIGFRRSSSITILALRKPDAHRRCSATPISSPGTLDAFAELVLHRHSLRSPVRSLALGGIGAVSPGHTLAAVAVLRSLASAAPPIDIARAHNPSRIDFCRDFVEKSSTHGRTWKSGRPKCAAETCPASRNSSVHIGDFTAHRLAYSAILKVGFRKRKAGCRGVLRDKQREKNPFSL